MEYRVALPEEAQDVWAVIQDGRRALAELGIDQWQGSDPSCQRIVAEVQAGVTRVAVDEETGALLGTLAFVEGEDEDYENNRTGGAWLSGDGSGGYVAFHRVAVSAQATRRGVAGFLFENACKEAVDKGLASARVDTHPGNIPMQRCLQKYGFSQCCELDLKYITDATSERIGFERIF